MTVVLICMALGLVTVLLHQSGLVGIAQGVARIPERWIGTVVPAILMGIFGLHLCEIGLYAIAMWVATDVLHLGRIVGDVAGTSLDLVYFSAETYTSLGFGDILPSGPMRLIVSFEPLNGLLLLGWSASFIHLEVERYWRRPDLLGAAPSLLGVGSLAQSVTLQARPSRPKPQRSNQIAN